MTYNHQTNRAKGRLRIKLLVVQLVFLAQSTTLLSKDVILTRVNGRVSDYSKKVDSIGTGDRVVFGSQQFTILDTLGFGGSERIFDIGNGKALRIYLKEGPSNFDLFWEAMEQFEGQTLPIPKLYKDDSKYNEFRIVEQVDVLFTLEDMIYAVNNWPGGTYKRVDRARNFDRATMYSAFLDFAKAFARYSSIDDFKPANIAFDGQKWWLLDCDYGVVEASHSSTKTLFDSFSGFPRSLLQRIREATILKRNPKTIQTYPSSIQRLCDKIGLSLPF